MQYNNLDDLLGEESAYHFGRMLYKYTDCGPWTTFVVSDKPARIERAQVEIRLRDKHLYAQVIGQTGEVAQDALLGLGFAVDGSSKLQSLDRLERSILRFKNEIDSGKVINPFMKVADVAQGVGGVLRVEMFRELPATTRSVYYGDDEARNPIKGCIGIEIGSIVEGSDVEITPQFLAFPFTDEQLDETVKSINSDAIAVWDWANETYDKLGRKHRYGKTMAEMGVDCPLF